MSDLLRRPGRAAWAILAVALAVRLLVLAATADYVPVADPADYHRHGVAIADGGYPQSTLPQGGATAYRPPGYPVFLGAVYGLTGRGWHAARAAQALVGTVTVALIGLLAFQLLGRAVGLAAMGLAAVHPPLLAVGAGLVAEGLALPLVIGATCAALHARRGGGSRWAVAAGVLAGLAILTRVNAALVLPLLAVLAWGPLGRGAGVRTGAVVIVAGVLTIVPWTVRNAVVLDDAVAVSTQAGYTLAGTYNDAARAGSLYPASEFPAQWVEWYRVPEYLRITEAGGNEVQIGSRLREAALEYAVEHPRYVLGVVAHNLARLFHLEAPLAFARYDAEAIGLPAWLGVAEAIGWWLLVLAAGVGALLSDLRRIPIVVWLVALAVLPSVLFSSYLRFRVPIDALLLVLAGAALVGLAHLMRRPAQAALRS